MGSQAFAQVVAIESDVCCRVSWQTFAPTVCPVGGRAVVTGKSGSFFHLDENKDIARDGMPVSRETR